MSDCLFDYAVYIGRFQPPHRGHCQLIRQAASLAPCLIMAIGSADTAPSIRNPFSFEERQAMFGRLAATLPSRLECVAVRDSAYNFGEWLAEVHTQVQAVLVRDGKPDASVVLIGAYKDNSSFYLDYFPGWSFRRLEVVGAFNSTAVRELLYRSSAGEGQLSGRHLTDLAEQVETPVAEYLQHWYGSPGHAALCEEYRQVAAYRQSWAGSPYPPVFVTVDAVVLCNSHILVIRRGQAPGKGCLALPGGFLEPEERLQQACVRELTEETGIDPAELEVCLRASEVFDDPQRDPRGRVVTHAFMFDLGHRDSLPVVAAADDAAEAFWFPVYELAGSGRLFFGDHHRIIRYFLNRLH
jgi:bifunctional NMN adenylyltransferase/nudix hydrolase